MKTKFKINGKELNLVEYGEHKLKQLNEAISLLEDFSDRIMWAEDFCPHPCIHDALDSVFTAVEHSKDELEEMQSQLEDELESYKKDKELTNEEFDESSNLAYALAE
jgi:hypothetical protein